MKQRGHRNFIIAQVIEELKNQNLLDDRIFAKLWIGDRIALKPSGKNLLIKELKSKGVSEEVIEWAFGEFEGTYDEYEIASALARRKIRSFRGLEEEKAKKRLLDFLSRRGFSYNIIWRVLKEIYKDADIEP